MTTEDAELVERLVNMGDPRPVMALRRKAANAITRLTEQKEAAERERDEARRSCNMWSRDFAASEAHVARLRESFITATASLAAAISLLERTPKAKLAAPSNKMFDVMLSDYKRSLKIARTALSAEPSPSVTTGETE